MPHVHDMFMVKFPNVPQKLMKIPTFAQVSNAIEAQAGTLLEFVGDEAGPGIVDGLLRLLLVLWMFCGCLVIQVTDII